MTRHLLLSLVLVAASSGSALAATASITFFDIASTDIGLDYAAGGSEILTVRDDDNDGIIRFE